MDKTSVKVLLYMNSQSQPVSAEKISEKFGSNGEQSLKMLHEGGYISRSIDRHETSGSFVHVYELEPLGRDFLEHRFGILFDKWLSRANGLLPILGGALLSKPLWAILDWAIDKAAAIWEWILRWF